MFVTGSVCLLLGAVLGIAVVYLAPPLLIREEDDEKNKTLVETKDKSTLTSAQLNHGHAQKNTGCCCLGCNKQNNVKDKVPSKDKSALIAGNVFNGHKQVDGIEQVNVENEQMDNENTLDNNITEQDNNGNTQFVNRSERSDNQSSENERIRQILENVQSEISREWNADIWTFVVPAQSSAYSTYYDADSHISTPSNHNILVLSNNNTTNPGENNTEDKSLRPTQPPTKRKKTTHKIYRGNEIRYSSSFKNNSRNQNRQQPSALANSKNQTLIEIEESNIIDVHKPEVDPKCNKTPVKKKGNVVVRLKSSKSPLRRAFRTVMSTLHLRRSAHRKDKFLNIQNNQDNNNNNENYTNNMDNYNNSNDNNNNSISHITAV